jgi:hypothetical protein
MLNIRSHVPVVLSADEGNFRQWRSFIELAIKKFGLLDHINGTVDAAAMFDDPEWLQIDACIVSWLYNTISKEIWNEGQSPQRDRALRLDRHHEPVPRQQPPARRVRPTRVSQPVPR